MVGWMGPLRPYTDLARVRVGAQGVFGGVVGWMSPLRPYTVLPVSV